MQIDYVSIIVSEVFDIVVTVFLVDRILDWREKNKWKHVRFAFLVYSVNPVSELILHWQRWLLSLKPAKKKAPEEKELTDLEKEIRKDYPQSTPQQTQQGHEMFKQFFGEPVGSNFPDYLGRFRSSKSKEIFTAISYLEDYLENTSSSAAAWSKLIVDIEPSVNKLNDIVGKYANMVDPAFALPIINLSLFLDKAKEGKLSPDNSREIRTAFRQTVELFLFVADQYGAMADAGNGAETP